tara:strand:- start:1162 stop:1626 length:465 start_codon:yes stop_codon:yes gene_type:complete
VTYPEFSNDLYEVYKSEVMGEALFTTAAFLSWNRLRKEKWIALAKLETQTKERYLAHVKTHQPYPYPSRLTGFAFGLLLAALPWRTSMRLLDEGTQPLIKVFSRLLESSTESSKAFFHYVAAHELAIAGFAQRELAGEPDSLAPVRALLPPIAA